MAGENGIDLRHASPNLPAPGGHYSHTAMGQGLVFVSGQLPIRPDGTRLVDASFEDQARQALANLAAALELAGSGVPRPSTASMPTGSARTGPRAPWCPRGRCISG